MHRGVFNIFLLKGSCINVVTTQKSSTLTNAQPFKYLYSLPIHLFQFPPLSQTSTISFHTIMYVISFVSFIHTTEESKEKELLTFFTPYDILLYNYI